MNGKTIGGALRGIAEALGGDGRCGACREWPAQRVVYADDDDGFRQEALEKWNRERFGQPMPPPECPNCHFHPLVIEIKYVDIGRTADRAQWLMT
jgi:hypothetical protein